MQQTGRARSEYTCPEQTRYEEFRHARPAWIAVRPPQEADARSDGGRGPEHIGPRMDGASIAPGAKKVAQPAAHCVRLSGLHHPSRPPWIWRWAEHDRTTPPSPPPFALSDIPLALRRGAPGRDSILCYSHACPSLGAPAALCKPIGRSRSVPGKAAFRAHGIR